MLDGTMATAVLSELGVGTAATVAGVDGDGPVLVRLLEMGFVAGTPVQLVKVAPFGDPLQFRVRGYHISLRRAEAARIRVEPT
jgi:ferrous iron transport protein A